MPMTHRVLCATVCLGVLILPCEHRASRPLETETARLMPAGRLKVESTSEYQRSSEGSETSVPMALEWAILDTRELPVEPVWYTAIRPKVGVLLRPGVTLWAN